MSGRYSQFLLPLLAPIVFSAGSATAQQQPSPSFSKILSSRATMLKMTWEKNFALPQSGHVVAHLQIYSDTDWEDPKIPAALLEVAVDERLASHLVTYAGRFNAGHPYAVHLGFLTAGQHELVLQRADSANAAIKLQHVRLDVYYAHHPFYSVLNHAPIIFGRLRRHRDNANSAGNWRDSDMRYSGVPLLLAYESRTAFNKNAKENRDRLNAGQELQYTVFFSTENGGASPQALLHLWGRYTDIEWAYRVELDGNGKRLRSFFQGKDHQEFSYFGGFENERPALQVATRNNMFSDSLTTPLRFALPPFFAIPADGVRESVMLEAPWTWRVSAKEARREQRLHAQPTDTTRIADLRRYLYIQFIAEPEKSGTKAGGYFIAKYKNDPNEYLSNLGNPLLTIRNDKTIARQTAVPLPVGIEADALQELEFVADASGGSVVLKNVVRLFSLDENDLPRECKPSWHGSLRLTPGQRVVLFKSK
jgi:hypothetical protein